MKEKNDLRRELRDAQMTINLMTEALELHKTYPKMPNKEFLSKMVYITQSAKIIKEMNKMKLEFQENVNYIQKMQHRNLNLKIAEDEKEPLLPLSSVLVPPKLVPTDTSLTSTFENDHFCPYYNTNNPYITQTNTTTSESTKEQVVEQTPKIESSVAALISAEIVDAKENESFSMNISQMLDFIPNEITTTQEIDPEEENNFKSFFHQSFDTEI